jgi:predicted acylesterase/phospholipase RssA
VSRNAAINSLRGFGTFRYASLRLLDDLIDIMQRERVDPAELEDYIQCAKELSFSLYWSLDLRHWGVQAADGPPAHKILLCSAAGQAIPLEALGHLLAYSIARHFDEPAAVVSFAADRSIHFWHPGGFMGPMPLPEDTDGASIISSLKQAAPYPFYHLVYVHPRAAEAAHRAERFHRIVYVNPEPEVTVVPPHLRGLLLKGLWNGDEPRIAPRFSSFISTHFLGEAQAPAAIDGAGWSARLASLGAAGGLRTQPTGDIPGSSPRPSNWRLRRDACRLAMDLRTIASAWHQWPKNGRSTPAFADALFEQSVGYKDSAFHWARAVTNRQVGLALSGGGASSYRLVPFIRRLRNELAVPVDVLGGVSGGALIGAYYCVQGLPGLDNFIAQGVPFTAFALAAVVSSRVISAKLDFDLLAARIERLETRFAPVTTMMTRGKVPEEHVVIGGTVGEGVRVSGSAPALWGQSILRRRHYSDGATAVLIPARALREHGADMVIACNCVPGPAEGNPLAYYLNASGLVPLWLAEKLSEYTLGGRIADALVAAAFFAQQASREMEEDAHLYMEPNPSTLPFLESFGFYDAPRLVAVAEREMREHNGGRGDSAAAATIWNRFRQSPVHL